MGFYYLSILNKPMKAKVIQGPADEIEDLLNNFLQDCPEEVAFIRMSQSIMIDSENTLWVVITILYDVG